jgi:hypothetical protein
MNKKIIKQYGEEILCYRLRSARDKKRCQYKDFDKQLIRINKERNRSYQEQRNLGWEPIVPPVQKGWKRLFFLREDVSRSPQAAFFENILQKINTVQYSHRKNFLKRRRKYGRKYYVVKEQELLSPEEWQLEKWKLTDKEQAFFHIELKWEKWRKEPVKIFVFNEPWRFVLKVKPNIIDRVRIKDAVLEARINEINDYLERNALVGRLQKILDGGDRRYRDWEKEQEKNVFRNKSLQQVLDLIKE